jgi:mRNA interferase RelE/StbE
VSDYRIEFDRRVKKDLKSVPMQEVNRIQTAISDLAHTPHPPGCKKLKGKNHEYFRIRVSDYRIIYTVENSVLLIIVICIGHRKEIYRKL